MIAADRNTVMLIHTLTDNSAIYTSQLTKWYHLSRVTHIWQTLTLNVLIDMCPFICPTTLRQD